MRLRSTGRGDLIQIAAPDTTSTAAKQEYSMTELQRFRPRLARRQYVPFNFDRASIQLLFSLRFSQPGGPAVPLRSEWRDASHLCWKEA